MGIFVKNQKNGRFYGDQISKTSAITLTGSSDITISYTSSWEVRKYTNFNSSLTVNTDDKVFQYSGGGVKIKEMGTYLCYSSVNVDGSFQASGAIIVNSATKVIHDIGSTSGMNNLTSVMQVLRLYEGDVVYAGYRISATGSYLSRGGRSCLTIVKVG